MLTLKALKKSQEKARKKVINNKSEGHVELNKAIIQQCALKVALKRKTSFF
jgi:hypothetical protein